MGLIDLTSAPKIELVALARLHPNARQPRCRFGEAELQALAESIKDMGVLQPILARVHPTRVDALEIVAGERRWRAAKLAGLDRLPVVICDLSDCAALELALIENIQREDLSPLERAQGYRRLIADFNHTQDSVALVMGTSRSHVANTLRLLNLPEALKDMLRGGDLSVGHARALLNRDRPEEMARQVVAKGLNVRQTESFARGDRPCARNGNGEEPVRFRKTETVPELSAMLGQKVTISCGARGCAMTIHCGGPDELIGLIRRLKKTLTGRKSSEDYPENVAAQRAMDSPVAPAQ